MQQVTIYRSDFNNNCDSTGRNYFDYILGQLNIPENKQSKIDEIILNVTSFKIYR